MENPPKFYHVADLANRLGAAVVVFDLETTTLRGRANFGITEVACFIVQPTGVGLAMQSLINPEHRIDARVTQLTGLRDADVRHAETWGLRYAALFEQLSRNQWVTGFNNATFDQPAVIEMNERYGHPINQFDKTFDVRRLHLALSGAESSKGSLSVVSALYGVSPKGALHRAHADVVLTLETLHAIIGVYGLDAVCNHILPKEAGAVDKLNVKAIAKYVKSRPAVTLEALASAFCKPVEVAQMEVGKAIDERIVNPMIFASRQSQLWLEEALMEVSSELLDNTRLKPLYDELLNKQPAAGLLDYVQLRIALTRAKLSWSSLKPGPAMH